MTSRLVLSKRDPRHTDFLLVSTAGDGSSSTTPLYTSDTMQYARPRSGMRAMTTVTRADPAGSGDRLQVGVIEWPVDLQDTARVVVGTQQVHMSRSGIFTSSERFTATDGHPYEWQIQDSRPQLVPLRGYTRTSTSYIATFVRSESGFFFRRKHTSSIFVPPEGSPILDDIVVTFIYFECKWRDKEIGRSRSSFSGSIV